MISHDSVPLNGYSYTVVHPLWCPFSLVMSKHGQKSMTQFLRHCFLQINLTIEGCSTIDAFLFLVPPFLVVVLLSFFPSVDFTNSACRLVTVLPKCRFFRLISPFITSSLFSGCSMALKGECNRTACKLSFSFSNMTVCVWGSRMKLGQGEQSYCFSLRGETLNYQMVATDDF